LIWQSNGTWGENIIETRKSRKKYNNRKKSTPKGNRKFDGECVKTIKQSKQSDKYPMNAYTNLRNLDIESQESNQAPMDRSTIDMENLPMNVSVEDEDGVDVDIALSDQLEQGRQDKYNGKLRFITFMKAIVIMCLVYVLFLVVFVLYVIIRMKLESGRQLVTDGSQGLVTEEVPAYTIRGPSAGLPGTSTSYSVPFAALVGNFGCDNCVRDSAEYDREREIIQQQKDDMLNYVMCWILCCVFIRVFCFSDRR
jgi:hypothetical protein